MATDEPADVLKMVEKLEERYGTGAGRVACATGHLALERGDLALAERWKAIERMLSTRPGRATATPDVHPTSSSPG